MTREQPAQEQRAAEADVERHRRELGPFVAAAEKTRMPMLFTNARLAAHPIVFVNDSLTRLTGFERDELLGRQLEALLAPNVDADTRQRFEAAFDGLHEDLELQFQCKNGEPLWVSMLASPVATESGEVEQHFVSLFNLTKHKEDQRRAEFLIYELNHRVRNNLTTLQAIVRHATHGVANGAAIRSAIEDRIHTIAASHELLERDAWRGGSIRAIVETALKNLAVPQTPARRMAHYGGPDIVVPPNEAFALLIALHELADNAVRYGALRAPTGLIFVDWTLEDGRIRIVWKESGGPPVLPPAKRGLGTYLIERGLPHQLHGAVGLDYVPQGIVCTIDFPAPSA